MTDATKSDMAAFGASDAACYSYPEDTDVAKAQRAAFCAGAAWSADEIERLRAWIGAIERITDEEIGVRFRTSSHKTEEQMAGKSAVYAMLLIPRNLSRAALRGDAFEQRESPK